MKAIKVKESIVPAGSINRIIDCGESTMLVCSDGLQLIVDKPVEQVIAAIGFEEVISLDP